MGEIIEPRSGKFCHIFKFTSDVFNSYVQNIVFPQKDFTIFRNFNTRVSSAVNFVSGKGVLSEILGKLLCLFLLLVKMAARQHVGAIVLFLFIKIKIDLPLIL
ncbi:MAG: hypothetical protein OIF50_10310 [Flavobacteriaceae bacterium]|nr:hypothetical protein [Flavobacteriaceae bacterium]